MVCVSVLFFNGASGGTFCHLLRTTAALSHHKLLHFSHIKVTLDTQPTPHTTRRPFFGPRTGKKGAALLRLRQVVSGMSRSSKASRANSPRRRCAGSLRLERISSRRGDEWARTTRVLRKSARARLGDDGVRACV